MTSWLPPYEQPQQRPIAGHRCDDFFWAYRQRGDMTPLRNGIDGGQPATPLDTFKRLARRHLLSKSCGTGDIYSAARWLWAGSGLTSLACRRRIPAVAKAIRWHIPVSFADAGAMRRVSWLFSPATLASPQLHLLSGATMLGAFFYLDDPLPPPRPITDV
ncbi:RnfABCDGE type electron transport complex subunit D [Salmonella enterica subsp. enterica]|nr:RnfABCDGE type electron transport complex subunit D [Salmonella enterica subsp. enterica]